MQGSSLMELSCYGKEYEIKYVEIQKADIIRSTFCKIFREK